MVQVRKAPTSIRHPKNAAEWSMVRELCCRTGAAGEPIARERWPFFADFWIGPYQKLLPQWTYLADVGGTIVGYLTGCPDTEAFEKKKRFSFTAPLLLQVGLRKYPRNADVSRFVRRTLKIEKGPELFFSDDFRNKLLREYPAHLHVNVDSACRGLGLGSQLVDAYLNDLRKNKIAGVHVYCGAEPVQFYKSVGFVELDSIEFQAKPGAKSVRVYSMGCSVG